MRLMMMKVVTVVFAHTVGKKGFRFTQASQA